MQKLTLLINGKIRKNTFINHCSPVTENIFNLPGDSLEDDDTSEGKTNQEWSLT